MCLVTHNRRRPCLLAVHITFEMVKKNVTNSHNIGGIANKLNKLLYDTHIDKPLKMPTVQFWKL